MMSHRQMANGVGNRIYCGKYHRSRCSYSCMLQQHLFGRVGRSLCTQTVANPKLNGYLSIHIVRWYSGGNYTVFKTFPI